MNHCHPNRLLLQVTATTTTTGTPSTSSSSSSSSLSSLKRLRTLSNHFCALRHGQSQANVQRIIASHPAIACTQYGLSSPTGHAQARQAGHDIVQYYYKNNSSPDPDQGKGCYAGIAILSSDLLRAVETAQHVRDVVRNAHHHHHHHSPQPLLPIRLYQEEDRGAGQGQGGGGEIILEPRLRERDFGDYDGSSDDHYERVWEHDAVDASHTHAHVESVDAVMTRVTHAIVDWDQTLKSLSYSSSSSSPPTNHNTLPWLVICVAHGDVLQILQTAFLNMPGSMHRSLPHLETATLRPLILHNTNDNDCQ